MRRFVIRLLSILFLVLGAGITQVAAQQHGRLAPRTRSDTTRTLTRGRAPARPAGAVVSKGKPSMLPGTSVPIPLLAQQCQVDCGGGGDTGGGGGGTYAVTVTPDGGTPVVLAPYTTNQTAVFMVVNTGTLADSYGLTCLGTDSIACVSFSPSSLSLNPRDSAAVTVTYSALGAAASQKVQFVAFGEGGPDTGYVNVTIAAPAGAPVLSTAPHNGGSRDPGRCFATCFDVTFAASTPGYQTLGVMRSLGLQYNSGTAAPINTISLDVKSNTGYAPVTYSFQATKVSNGAAITFLNGSTTFWSQALGTALQRVVLPFDPRANSMPTGEYLIQLTATSTYSGGLTYTNVTYVRVLVVDEGGSAFGAGVGVAGLQRLYLQSDGTRLVVGGDGSAAFYRCSGSTCPIPAGTSAAMSTVGSTYVRANIDGTKVVFNSTGRMINAIGNLADTTTFIWTDTLLTQIKTPRAGTINLVYDGVTKKLTQVYDSLLSAIPRRTNYTITGGRLVKATDPDSLYTQFGYDSLGRLTSTTDRAGQVTNMSYDVLSRLNVTNGPVFTRSGGGSARVTGSMIAGITRVWSAAGTGTSSGSAKGATLTDSAYAMITDGRGGVTRANLDRFGVPTRTVDAVGAVTIAVVDTMGRVLSDTTPAGLPKTYDWGVGSSPYLLHSASTRIGSYTRTVSYSYDGSLRMTGLGGDIEARLYSYVGGTTELSTETVGGVTLRTHYPGGLGLDTAVVDNGGHRQRWIYDAKGNDSVEVAANGTQTIHYRDAFGRDTAVKRSLAGTFTVTYNSLNRVTKTKDPLGIQVFYTFDALGRVVRIKDGKNQVYRFTYGPNGQTAVYDVADTLLATTYAYDSAGQLVNTHTRRGDDVTSTYDIAGRLTSMSGPDFPADSFAYSPTGTWVKGWNANSKDSVAFDVGGRPTQVAEIFGTQTWAWGYDYLQRGYPFERYGVSGTFASLVGDRMIGYTNDGVPTSFNVMDAIAVTLGRNVERNVNSITYGYGQTGWSFGMALDANHADSSITYYPAAVNNLWGGWVRRDSLGRVKVQKYNGTAKDRVFAYDLAGQMTAACDSTPGGSSCTDELGLGTHSSYVTYSFDAAGNRILASADSAATAVGAGNRLHRSRGWYFTYDADGNTLTKCKSATGCSDGYKYKWNALGQLTEVDDENNVLLSAFKYDASGRRVERRTVTDTTRFIYADKELIAEASLSGTVRVQYAYWPGETDHLLAIKTASFTAIATTAFGVNTVMGLGANLSGTPIKNFTIDAWGRITVGDTGTVTRIRLAGREYDQETGLYYNRARYYDADVGRFISEDPIGVAGGLNLYAYAGGDPTNASDPSGNAMAYQPADENPLPRMGADYRSPGDYDGNGYDDGIEFITDVWWSQTTGIPLSSLDQCRHDAYCGGINEGGETYQVPAYGQMLVDRGQPSANPGLAPAPQVTPLDPGSVPPPIAAPPLVHPPIDPRFCKSCGPMFDPRKLDPFWIYDSRFDTPRRV